MLGSCLGLLTGHEPGSGLIDIDVASDGSVIIVFLDIVIYSSQTKLIVD